MAIKDRHHICKNRSVGRHIIEIGIMILALALIIPSSSAATSGISDPALKINIGSEVFEGGTYPTVTLENSVQKAVIRTQKGGMWGAESVIKDWILKSAGTDLVDGYVDANSFRGALSSATITVNGENSKTVRLIYAHGSIMEYTIDANSPVIKIKYEKYDVIQTSNIVDRTNTGGAARVYGQGGWIRTIESSYYPCAYWDTYDTTMAECGIRYGPDPVNAGSLNYKGYTIMAFGQTASSGIGLGRVMPIYTGTNGGIKITKIFSSGGFETYQANPGQSTRPVHYGYIYLFNTGVGNAITQGQQIVDGSPVASGPVAPSIVKQPSNQNVALGDRATFSVEATGTAPLTYQWQKNGANIAGATSATITTSITIPADSGSTYRAVVTNSVGSVTSNAATLTVLSIPSITVVSPNGGENWVRGTTRTISWTSTGSSGANVKVELLKSGVLNSVLASSTPNDGSHSLTISATQTPGSDYKVRITSTTDAAYTDISNNNFIISETLPADPTPTPPPPSASAPPNPGFEIDGNGDNKPDSWFTNVWSSDPSKIAFNWATDQKYGGTHSVKITSTDTNGKARWLTDRNIPVTPGTSYSFNAYIKTSGLSKTAHMAVTFWDSSLKYIPGGGTNQISGTAAWTLVSGKVTAPPGAAYARVELLIDGSGTVWFDDVAFKSDTGSVPVPGPTVTPTPPAPAPSINLAPNPGVEIDSNGDKKPDSWFTNVWSSDPSKIAFIWATDQKYGGTYSVKITSTDPNGNARWMTDRNIAVIPGKSYSFNAYIKTSGLSKTAHMAVTFWDSSFKYIPGGGTNQIGGTAAWTQAKGTAVAPSGAAYARIELRMDGAGTAWFDEVTLGTS